MDTVQYFCFARSWHWSFSEYFSPVPLCSVLPITLLFKKIHFFSQCDLVSAGAVHHAPYEGCGDATIKSPDHVAEIPALPESDHAAECLLFRQSDIRPTGALEAGRPHLLYSVVAVVRVLLLKGKVFLSKNSFFPIYITVFILTYQTRIIIYLVRRKDWERVEQLMDHWEERGRDPQVKITLVSWEKRRHFLKLTMPGFPYNLLPVVS
jgi:hypothetical protein